MFNKYAIVVGAGYAVYLAIHHLRAYTAYKRRISRRERRVAEIPAGSQVEGILTGPISRTTMVPYYVGDVAVSKNQPIVVLVAGNGLTAEYWRTLQRHLAEKGVFAVAYDQRTTVDRVHVPRELTIESQADELAVLVHGLRNVGLDHGENATSIVLVGHSMGCAVVETFVQRIIKLRQSKPVVSLFTSPLAIRAVILADPTPSSAIQQDPKARETFTKNITRLAGLLPFVSILADFALIRPFTDLMLLGGALKRSVWRSDGSTLTPTFSESSTILNMFATGFLLRRFLQESRILPLNIAESAKVQDPSRWVHDRDEEDERVVTETILLNGEGQNPFGWTLEEMTQKDMEVVDRWKVKKHLLDRSVTHMELVNSPVLMEAILSVTSRK